MALEPRHRLPLYDAGRDLTHAVASLEGLAAYDEALLSAGDVGHGRDATMDVLVDAFMSATGMMHAGAAGSAGAVVEEVGDWERAAAPLPPPLPPLSTAAHDDLQLPARPSIASVEAPPPAPSFASLAHSSAAHEPTAEIERPPPPASGAERPDVELPPASSSSVADGAAWAAASASTPQRARWPKEEEKEEPSAAALPPLLLSESPPLSEAAPSRDELDGTSAAAPPTAGLASVHRDTAPADRAPAVVGVAALDTDGGEVWAPAAAAAASRVQACVGPHQAATSAALLGAAAPPEAPAVSGVVHSESLLEPAVATHPSGAPQSNPLTAAPNLQRCRDPAGDASTEPAATVPGEREREQEREREREREQSRVQPSSAQPPAEPGVEPRVQPAPAAVDADAAVGAQAVQLLPARVAAPPSPPPSAPATPARGRYEPPGVGGGSRRTATEFAAALAALPPASGAAAAPGGAPPRPPPPQWREQHFVTTPARAVGAAAAVRPPVATPPATGGGGGVVGASSVLPVPASFWRQHDAARLAAVLRGSAAATPTRAALLASAPCTPAPQTAPPAAGWGAAAMARTPLRIVPVPEGAARPPPPGPYAAPAGVTSAGGSSLWWQRQLAATSPGAAADVGVGFRLVEHQARIERILRHAS